MKTTVSLLLVLALLLQETAAQQPRPAPKKLYKAWVSLDNGKGKLKGALYEVRDSSVIISTSVQKTDYFDHTRFDLVKLDAGRVDVIRVRRKNAIARGMLFGGIAGGVLGAAMGLGTTNTAEDPNVNRGISASSVIFGTVFFGACGAVIGALIAPIRKTVRVEGSRERFEKKRAVLEKRSLLYEPELTGQRITRFRKPPDSVTDRDGNVYHTLAMGNMVFMAENLRTLTFRNGTAIPAAQDPGTWQKAGGPAWCHFRSDSANITRFGRLYNGHAITDSAGLCPEGWHIPSQKEWEVLSRYFGGRDEAGGYLKADGTAYWASPNKTMLAGNEFAFPSGSRNSRGAFPAPGTACAWWCKLEKNGESLAGQVLVNESTSLRYVPVTENDGLAVRCIRN